MGTRSAVSDVEYGRALRRALDDDALSPNQARARDSEHAVRRQQFHAHCSQALCVHLLAERRRGPRSRFAPFIASLPPRYTTPGFLSDRALKALQHPCLVAAVAAAKQQAEHGLTDELSAWWREHVGPVPPAAEEWRWAVGTVQSRACFMEVDAARRDTAVLVPVADFANHTPGIAGRELCGWDEPRAAYCFRAARDYAAGEEVGTARRACAVLILSPVRAVVTTGDSLVRRPQQSDAAVRVRICHRRQRLRHRRASRQPAGDGARYAVPLPLPRCRCRRPRVAAGTELETLLRRYRALSGWHLTATGEPSWALSTFARGLVGGRAGLCASGPYRAWSNPRAQALHALGRLSEQALLDETPDTAVRSRADRVMALMCRKCVAAHARGVPSSAWPMPLAGT